MHRCFHDHFKWFGSLLADVQGFPLSSERQSLGDRVKWSRALKVCVCLCVYALQVSAYLYRNHHQPFFLSDLRGQDGQ